MELKIILSTILIVFLISPSIKCNLYADQEKLEDLFELHQAVAEILEDFLNKEVGRIRIIRLMVTPFLLRSKKTVSEVVENPINAYKLIKAMTNDLELFEEYVYDKKIHDFSSIIKKQLKLVRNLDIFPKQEDYVNAISALGNLQEFYGLSVPDFARNSEILGHFAEKLEFGDTYDLAFSKGGDDFYIVEEWLKESLIIYQRELKSGDINTFQKANIHQILEYLAYITSQRGDFREAFRYSKRLKQYETADHWSHRIDYVHEYVKEVFKGKIPHRALRPAEPLPPRVIDPKRHLHVEALCRGEIHEVDPRAKCKYTNNNDLYLLIGPHKEEVMSIDPKVSFFHDVLYDSEIELLKTLAYKNFVPSAVFDAYDPKEGESSGTNPHILDKAYKKRIGKTAWLKDEDHPTVRKISDRIGYLLGYEMATAEQLQVVKYGLAGHFISHYDHIQEKNIIEKGNGDLVWTNRMATFLIYMNEVELGGGTSFPYLNFTIVPKKGSAIFWYNTFENGEEDPRLVHSGCPVLLGKKWICNKWISNFGQELKRPCKKELPPKYEYHFSSHPDYFNVYNQK